MRKAVTHFEQVPKVVIEKILTQQNVAAETAQEGGSTSKKRPAEKTKRSAPLRKL
jgi:hypothetical protein